MILPLTLTILKLNKANKKKVSYQIFYFNSNAAHDFYYFFILLLLLRIEAK